jgi:hypothetical protein
MVLVPQGLLPHWPADYRSDAVERYRKYETGVISKAEMETQLAEKYPRYDTPHERTLRRWAHEKYSDLPERRRQFLGPQGLDWMPNYASVTASFQGAQTPVSWLVPQQVAPVQNGFSPMALDLINWMVVCMLLTLVAAAGRMVLSFL